MVGRSAGSRPRAFVARVRNVLLIGSGSPEGVAPVGRGWRLLGRELPLALTGGRAGVYPRFASSPGPRAWGVRRRAGLLGVANP